MLLRRTAAAVLGVLTLLPALAACGGSGDVALGDVVPAREDDQFAQGAGSSLTLPIGRLDVRVGDPVTRLRRDDTRELTEVEAPEGSSFVPVTWQYDAGTFKEYGDYLGDTPSPVVDLVSDGARYRVPPPEEEGRGSESFYVLVSGDGEQPSLQVDFDGVVQTVDLTTGERDEGDAAALYDLRPPAKKGRSCRGQASFPGAKGLAHYSCELGPVVRLPYAAGQWAEPGRAWLAFPATTALASYDVAGSLPGAGATYLPESVRTRFTVDGEEVAGVRPAPASTCPHLQGDGCTDAYFLAVDAGKGQRPELRIRQTFRLVQGATWGGFHGKQRIRLRAQVTVRVS